MTASARRQFQHISRRAQRLLAMGEGQLVEYKAEARGLDPVDLVAFANSLSGGSILIGVAEAQGTDGTQIGIPVGCAIGDEARLQVLGKAQSCSPPISLEIFAENLAGNKPFLRLEIESSSTKPHSSQRGTYVIQEDGRNAPLLPTMLLKMFLEIESDQFGSRFRETTTELTEHADQILEHIQQLEATIAEKIEDIGSTLGWADYKVGDTSDTIERVEAMAGELIKRVVSEGDRLRAITKKLEIDDPVKAKAKAKAIITIKNALVEDPDLLKGYKKGQALSMQLSGRMAEELSKEEMPEIFQAAARELLSEIEAEKKRRASKKSE